jgi:Ca2+-transporting ATPase
VKGSAEALLPRCVACLDTDGTLAPLDHPTIETQINAMAQQGLRVLTFAKKLLPLAQDSVNHADLESDLVFLGLQGMIDPPRPEAIAAVHACQSAGIQVKMITGDHIKTATAIARRMGLRKQKKVIAYTVAELAK